MFKRAKKNIALVGAGYWGKNLLRVFWELGALKAVYDTDKKTLREAKKEYPRLQIAKNFPEISNDGEVAAIVIAAPAATHYNLAKKCLEAGKDVFVEKPLALKVKEGEELVKLAKNGRKILMVGHLLQYHPAVVELKKIIKKGKLGKIRYIWSTRLNFGKLRREENVLWSFAPHDISVILSILGKPQKISASGMAYLQKNIYDTTLSFFEFKKGKAAHIFVSWLNPFKEQKFTVMGSKAMIVFDDQAKEKLVFYRHKVKRKKGGNPVAIKDKGKTIKISQAEPLKEEARHFLECIEKRKTPRTDGKEALEVLKILRACEKSIKNK